MSVDGALQINVNGEPFTITMRTPGDDECLVRGLLYSENVISDKSFKPNVNFLFEKDNTITVAEVQIPKDKLGDGYSNSRNLLSVASCGICGKTSLDEINCDALTDNIKIDPEEMQDMFKKMSNHQRAFNRSGGSHAAAAFDANYNLICAIEDIGRHNAVDKVIGYLILNDRLKDGTVMTVSGRISYEIVIKCFKARIPVLAAVSAPSSLALDFAKELGLTLFAFCRNNKSTCYSHTHRVKNQKLRNQAG